MRKKIHLQWLRIESLYSFCHETKLHYFRLEIN